MMISLGQLINAFSIYFQHLMHGSQSSNTNTSNLSDLHNHEDELIESVIINKINILFNILVLFFLHFLIKNPLFIYSLL